MKLNLSHIKCVYQKSTKNATYKSLPPLEVIPHPAAWLKILVFRVNSCKLTAKINPNLGNKLVGFDKRSELKIENPFKVPDTPCPQHTPLLVEADR